MKNLVSKITTIGKVTVVIIVAIAVIAAICSYIWYPNVVTGISPVRKASKGAQAALDSVAHAKDKEAALNNAVNKLVPYEHGRTLEERVAFWVGIPYSTVDSMKFSIVSGVGISAENALHEMEKGYTHNQVAVTVWADKSTTGKDYFLLCANGLVIDKNTYLLSQKAIGSTHAVSHIRKTAVDISDGGGLCRDLGMTEPEALAFAKANNMYYRYEGTGKKRKLNVIVQPGDIFEKDGGSSWRMVKF